MLKLRSETKLSKALELHPDVLPYIINLNPHKFGRLNSSLMHKLMPPRITLARLANMVDMSVHELIHGIYSVAHIESNKDLAILSDKLLPTNTTEVPEWIDHEIVETVDLLACDELLNTDPFVPLFPALKRTGVGEVLLLKHKWEPQPLYDVWDKLGIEFFSVEKSPVEWWIYLKKTRAGFRG